MSADYRGKRYSACYTWHHLDDLVVDASGDAWCSMQLVQTSVHGSDGMGHTVSVGQLEKFFLKTND